MLSQLQTQEVIKVTYNDVIPVTAQILEFPTNEPYEVVAIRTRITAQGGIVLPGIVFRNELGNVIFNVGIIPWQFAGTTIETTTGQTPDPSITAFFAPAILGFIPSDLHAFSGWSIIWTDFIGTPGVTFEGELFFALAKFDDETL